MAMKSGERGIKRTIELSKRERGNPDVLKASWAALYLVLGFIMAGGRVLTDGAPFGLALVAAAGAGLNGMGCLAGAALGYFATGGVEWGIRYVAACVLAFTAAFVFMDTKIYSTRFFLPTVAGIVMAATGFLGSFITTAHGAPYIIKVALETVLAFGSCLFFTEALHGEIPVKESAEQGHGIAVMLTLACLLASLSGLVILGEISIGRILAVLVLLACSMKGGLLTGAAVGTVLGGAMDICAGGTPFFTFAYAFAGLIAGFFCKHGRFVFVLAFILANAAAVLCAWDTALRTAPLFETFCAAVVFMLLPSTLLNAVGGALSPAERGSGESGLRKHVARHVKNLSDAYAELYAAVLRNADPTKNDADVSKVFDRAADAVCVSCAEKNRCWNGEYQSTLGAMNDASAAMTARGTLELPDLPETFRSSCEKPEAFVTAVNSELRARALRLQFRSELRENRNAAWGQYNDIAEILSNVSGELGSINSSDPLAERRLIRFLRTMDIDAETAVFRDSHGRLRAVIESGKLSPLLNDPEYLDKLSAVLGVRLCRPRQDRSSSCKLTVIEAEPLAVSVGIAAMKKQGERVSGDKGTYFKTDDGVLCVILSDGMGCGDEAAKESEECVSILEKFLRAGVDPGVAMKILNSVMLLRGGENWGFATVDLMCVNLFTGDACFYKYGAAPSYVFSGRVVKRIKGETMAAGLSAGDGAAPDVVHMRLRPGSTAIIASDGVAADGNDTWLKELLVEQQGDMKSLARAAINKAGALYGNMDDMTVLAIKVESRS